MATMLLQQSPSSAVSIVLSTLDPISTEAQVPALPQPISSRADPNDTMAVPLSGLRSPSSDGMRLATGIDMEASTAVVESMENLSGKRNRYRLAAICLTSLLGGFNDSAAGALIPYIETYYGIGYAMVSLIFVGAALGFITAAPLVARIQARLGWAKTFALSQTMICFGNIPIICAAPFPMVVVSFFVIGFGSAVNLPISNVFCARFANAPTLLGLSAGSYGVGGIISPLIATAMVTAGNLLWSRYYIVTLCIAAFNIVFAAWSFWDYEVDFRLRARQAAEDVDAKSRLSALVSAFQSRVVLLGALFIFAYQGAEVSISGWVVSFLIDFREGNPAQVGYVSAGFWAGITIGRFILSPLGHKLGEKKFVYGMIIGGAAFDALVWLVPNVIGNAVALAIVGLLLGPVWPCATIVFTRNLSRREQVMGLSIISAFGSSGGAFMPLGIGLLSQEVGTFVLHPFVIGLSAIVVLCWFGIPAARKRPE